MKTKKILAVVFVLLLVLPTVTSCSKAPSVASLYDRVTYLLEESQKVNYMIYGVGLPTEKQGSDWAEMTHLYSDFAYDDDYEILSDYAFVRYQDSISTLAERVYSASFLDEVVNPALFVGYAFQDGKGSTVVDSPRYMEEENSLYVSTSFETLYHGVLMYDFSTMYVEKQSTEERAYVTLNAYYPENTEKVISLRVSLVKENGEWMLDSFAG